LNRLQIRNTLHSLFVGEFWEISNFWIPFSVLHCI
jgi:hypothetical protein